MDNLLSEIYRGIKEKVSSPFFRYFAISYIGWNYKFIYFIFFQDQEIFEKVHSITKFDYLISGFYINEWWFIFSSIILPILSTLFFVYLFPWINRRILTKHRENLTNENEDNFNYKKKVREDELKLSSLELEEKVNQKKSIELEKEIELEKKFNGLQREVRNMKNSEAAINQN